MADVFLSYARSSETFAKMAAGALRDAGLTVWFDENLPAHRAFSDVIEEELELARAVLVLWSRDAAQSQWVRSEANRARETGRLVQLRLDDVRLPMPFDQIQCADLRGWNGDRTPAWDSVLASIADLRGDRPSDVPPPASIAATGRAGIGRRRMVIGGGAVIAAAALGNAAWQAFQKPKMSAEARLLFQKGTDALQTNDAFDPNNPEAAQAVAILTDATRLAPNSAEAWGALAMAYAVRKKSASPAERPGFDARSRSAAKRALELDSRDMRAIGALRMLDPIYRNWLAAERADREAIAIQPKMPLLLFHLADVLGSVGRWKEGASYSRKFDRSKFVIAGADRQVIVGLWAAGDLAGADEAVRGAVEHWPQHPQIWRTRLAYLMYSGRPDEALRLLRDSTERPANVDPAFVEGVELTAESLAGRGDPGKAVRANLDYVAIDPTPATMFAAWSACAALGDLSALLPLVNGYYFAEGPWTRLAPPGGDEDRITAPLFLPPMLKVWNDRRFAQVLDRIGLSAYWRASGTLPDFRRTS